MTGCLSDIIFGKKYIGTEERVKMYKSMTRLMLTYATETRAMTNGTAEDESGEIEC